MELILSDLHKKNVIHFLCNTVLFIIGDNNVPCNNFDFVPNLDFVSYNICTKTS